MTEKEMSQESTYAEEAKDEAHTVLEAFNRLIQPGVSVRTYHNFPDEIDGLWHIRAVVDDNQIVVREWSKYKKRWYYRVVARYFLWLLWRDGRLKKVGTRSNI